ncbi:MAG: hypothetical protein AAFR73_05515 [Pseudomonadota bacterium]
MRKTIILLAFVAVFGNAYAAEDPESAAERQLKECEEISKKAEGNVDLSVEEGEVFINCLISPDSGWDGFNAEHEFEGIEELEVTPWLYREGQV